MMCFSFIRVTTNTLVRQARERHWRISFPMLRNWFNNHPRRYTQCSSWNQSTVQRRMIGARFQVLSDLHLEVGNQYDSFEVPHCAPYLILAGDIGLLVEYDKYLRFLQRTCKHFKKVFLVLGNHEFYGTSREEGLEAANDLANSISNLTLLQQTTVEVEGILVLGCILGSWVPDSASRMVSLKLNDFYRIKDWTVARHNEAHVEDLSWLKEEMKATRSSRVLVVSHYAPEITQTSAPDKVNGPITSAFATDLICDNNAELRKVSTWIFGHTHYTTDFIIDGVRVLSNQRGYVMPGRESTIRSTSIKQKIELSQPSGPMIYDPRRTITI